MSDDVGKLATALRALTGVSSATVEPDAAGSPEALRLRVDPGADGVEVARAAGQLLAEHLGTSAGAPVVNIVIQDPEPTRTGTQDQPIPEQAPTVPTQRRSRLSVGRTDVVTDDLVSSATVALSSAAGSATGLAQGVATRAGLHRAVAQATVRALEQLIVQPASIGLDHLLVASTGDRSTVLVSLTLVTPRGAEHLTGSAIVRQDEVGAVVRATLDALNRRLDSLLH